MIIKYYNAVLLKQDIIRNGFRTGLEHYAALLYGYTSTSFTRFIIEKTPEGIIERPYVDGEWKIVSHATQQALTELTERVRIAKSSPEWDAAPNNCESFARYIVEGRYVTTQAGEIALLATLTIAGLISYFDNR